MAENDQFMDITLEGIVLLWVRLFRMFFIPMLVIPLLLVPSFVLIKRKSISNKTRFIFLGILFSYLFIIGISFLSVYYRIYAPHTFAYAMLWLSEFFVCFYIVLVIYRKQLQSNIPKRLFSNRNVALAILSFFLILSTASWAISYYSDYGSLKVDGNVLIVQLNTPIENTRKIISFIKKKSTAESNILVHLDSSGGVSGEIWRFSNFLLNLKNKSCCYIEEKCFRGAVFIALSCDAIVMREGSRIGNLGPIRLDNDAVFKGIEKRGMQERINKEMKERALRLSKGKYSPHVILGMFGDNSDSLMSEDSSFSSVSEANPLVLSAETALRLNVSKRTVKGIGDVLAFLRREDVL